MKEPYQQPIDALVRLADPDRAAEVLKQTAKLIEIAESNGRMEVLREMSPLLEGYARVLRKMGELID